MHVDNLQKSIEFAVKAHKGQIRECNEPLPYITHCFEVLSNLRSIGEVTAEASLVAAMLHDVVEAGSTTIEQLELKFGHEVADLVRQLTRTEPSDVERAELSEEAARERRAELLLLDIAQMNPAAQAIKLADRLANVRDARRQKGYDSLQRYVGQTENILLIIPKDVNKPLWKAVNRQVKKARS